MSAFSSNVIFFDAEFSSLDPHRGEIISLALINRAGKELYLELEYDENAASEWVKENILPLMLGDPKVSKRQAAEEIAKFTGDGKPYLVTYVSPFDVVFLHKIFAEREWPFHWLPLDFSSIMFACSRDPEKQLTLAKELGVDTHGRQMHSALSDARVLRETYLAWEKSALAKKC